MTAPILTARGAFADVVLRLDTDAVSMMARDELALATVQVRKGAMGELKRRVQESFGIELPMGQTRASAGGVAFAGTAPGVWLASNEGGGSMFAASLAQRLRDVAAVADQSDGFGVVRLSGSRVRELLSRLLPVDVHERAFRIGGVAATVSGYVGVTLWRLEDMENGAPVYEVAVSRSFAASFARALEDAVG